MGNSASAGAVGAVDDTAGAPPSEALTSRSARLYLYDAAAAKWNVERAMVEVDFADNAAEGDAPDWHVEVRHRAATCSNPEPAVARSAPRRAAPPRCARHTRRRSLTFRRWMRRLVTAPRV